MSHGYMSTGRPLSRLPGSFARYLVGGHFFAHSYRIVAVAHPSGERPDIDE